MDRTKWLDADEVRAWHSFLTAGALIDRRIDQQLKEAVGLSHPQYEILVRPASVRTAKTPRTSEGQDRRATRPAFSSCVTW